jgi:WD40 repeat protein
MMSERPFYAKDMSVNAQTFLYACAFWTVAADENLKPAEQRWLVEQFGEDGATQSLEDFVALESNEFFSAFDTAAAGLTDAEKMTIYPHLETWLLACAAAEGRSGDEERAIVAKIAERISLASELARLAGSPASPTPAGPVVRPGLLEGHESEVSWIRFTGDGAGLLSASEDKTLRLWSFAESGSVTVFSGHDMAVMAADVCPHGQHVLSGDRLGERRLWRLADATVVWAHHESGHGGVTDVSVRPDGAQAAVASDIGLITLVDMTTGAAAKTFSKKRYGAAHGVCFTPDGQRLLSGGDDRDLRVWDVATGNEMAVLSGHEDGIMAVAVHPDGTRAATASRDNTVRVWDLSTGSVVQVLEGHTFTIHDVAFSADGTRLASASWDHWLRVWDVPSGRELLNAEDTDARFCSVAFHPSGSCLATGNSDGHIRIFDLTEL